VQPKDVVNVLNNMIRAARPGGTILDLQVIRPHPRIELSGELVCEIDGSALFDKADAATAAVDASVARGILTEQVRDDHDVVAHYSSGRDLIEDFEDKLREIPKRAIPRLREITGPLVIRERCRLRRLRLWQTGTFPYQAPAVGA
jgi:hypothetical protein